jgi:hypothetical protein
VYKRPGSKQPWPFLLLPLFTNVVEYELSEVQPCKLTAPMGLAQNTPRQAYPLKSAYVAGQGNR